MSIIKTRSMLLFEESIKSKYTKKNYSSHLRQFKRFAATYAVDDLTVIGNDRLQDLLEDYMIELRHTANPNSIPSRLQGIKHFCIMNRISLDWDIIRKMLPQKQKAPSLRAYTTEEVRRMIRNIKSARDLAIVHFLASTGARIGVFDHNLSVKHLRKMSHGCCAVRLYAGYVEEYWGFLTPQASGALDVYHKLRKLHGETFCEKTPIFATRGGTAPTQLGWSGARSVIYRTVSNGNVGISRIKQGKRYDVQVDHGFRKRFNTVLKLDNSVNYNIAEKLMGHKNGLDGTYFTPTLEEMFTEFKKVISRIEI